MATSVSMVHMPLKAVRYSLLSIATGLCRNEHGALNIFDLTVENVRRNVFHMLQTYSPSLGHVITAVVPVAWIGVELYRWGCSGLEIRDYIFKRFTVDVTIPAGTTLNAQVVDYMADHNDRNGTQSMTVHENHVTRTSTSSKSSSALTLIPKRATNGWIRFADCWLMFKQTPPTVEKDDDEDDDDYYDRRRQKKRGSNQGAQEADVVVSAFSLTGNVDVIRRFLEHVRDINKEEPVETTEQAKEPTRITRLARRSSKSHPPGTNPWARPINKAARDMNSVTMEAEAKRSLLADIKKYIDSSMWYHNRGIGWRRGYLLYGPPGTGKTSITTAIAGHFDLPLYIISFADSITDDVLETAFDHLPSQCVVLMEDIDSAGIGRENMMQGGGNDNKFSLKKTITLSGLLNAIDGPVAKEGRILVMTSNTPDSLDPALVRPGRIDRKVLFGYAKKEVTSKLFTHIFSDDDCEAGDPYLERLSLEFAASVPENKLTPAEIQGFLLVNRDDPQEAVNLAECWAEDLAATKLKGSNVAQFNGQIGVIDGGRDISHRGRSRSKNTRSSSDSGSLLSKPSSRSDSPSE